MNETVSINESELRKPLPERRERGDLDDPKKIARKETIANLREKEHISDFGWILSDVRGRRFIWKYLASVQVFDVCFTGNNSTFFNLGERNAGLRILKMINDHFPEAYLMMLQEAKIESQLHG